VWLKPISDFFACEYPLFVYGSLNGPGEIIPNGQIAAGVHCALVVKSKRLSQSVPRKIFTSSTGSVATQPRLALTIPINTAMRVIRKTMDDFWLIIVLADKSWKATELMGVRMWERIQQLYSEGASLRQRCNYKVLRLEKHSGHGVANASLDNGLIKTLVLNTNIAVIFVGSGILSRRASLLDRMKQRSA